MNSQGNLPFDHTTAFQLRALASQPAPGFAPAQFAPVLLLAEYSLYAARWLKPDPQAKLQQMSVDEMASAHEVIPPGVVTRHRSSPFYPVQVPDLIGVKDRRYLDPHRVAATSRHRGPDALRGTKPRRRGSCQLRWIHSSRLSELQNTA
jgi:hypothetical protein